jgi:hypothetical protein
MQRSSAPESGACDSCISGSKHVKVQSLKDKLLQCPSFSTYHTAISLTKKFKCTSSWQFTVTLSDVLATYLTPGGWADQSFGYFHISEISSIEVFCEMLISNIETPFELA